VLQTIKNLLPQESKVLTESRESWCENRAADRNPDCNCCNGDELEGEKLLPKVFLSLRALPGMFTGAELPSIPTKKSNFSLFRTYLTTLLITLITGGQVTWCDESTASEVLLV
jgi:hypothetical protein